MPERHDILTALETLEACTRLMDKDHPDLEAYKRSLASVRAQLDAFEIAEPRQSDGDDDHKKAADPGLGHQRSHP